MENLTVTDLMVGDWVMYNPNVFIEDEYEPIKKEYHTQIKSGEDIDLAIEGCYKPILLTPEILEKNGFAIIGDQINHECDSFTNLFEIADNIVLGDADGCYVVCYERWNGEWDCYDHFPVIEITSVHELQHVLKSLKNGKDIVL